MYSVCCPCYVFGSAPSRHVQAILHGPSSFFEADACHDARGGAWGRRDCVGCRATGPQQVNTTRCWAYHLDLVYDSVREWLKLWGSDHSGHSPFAPQRDRQRSNVVRALLRCQMLQISWTRRRAPGTELRRAV